MITMRDVIAILIAGQMLPALGWAYLLGGTPNWLLAVVGQWLTFDIGCYLVDRAAKRRLARRAYDDIQKRMQQDGLIGRRRR